jgi:tetratricopeptide (TPR) repeat protein/nucleotide-binding universal stress UspA family protein
VIFSSFMRGCRIGTAVVALLMVGSAGAAARAQAAPEEAATAGQGRILLVLPFDNRTGQPSLDWIREAVPQVLGRRFASAGFAPMSRQDRLYALDHLGLPAGFQPSRASALKLAQTLDADSIVVGSYRTEGTQIEAEAQVVDVPHLRMSAPVSARGEIRDMLAVFDSLAWKLTRGMDPDFSVAEETFVVAGRGVRLDAFEQYTRGITEPDHEERLRHLHQAVTLSPDLSAAWTALGREDFSAGQYDEAAAAFARVSGNDPDALEAGFDRGLVLLFSGSYAEAEKAFAGVARVLPLAEVLNNQAVAVSRQGHDASALFVSAETADPNAPDYHFNLAVSLKRRGSASAALSELRQCLKLRPSDSEAQQLEKEWSAPAAVATTGGANLIDGAKVDGAKTDPLERIVRTFDAAAFRQAAVMMNEMQAARLQALAPHERAVKLAEQANEYLNRGLLLEAERLYQSSAGADGSVAEAHAGLAEVRERTGDTASARKEAEAALKLKPSAEAYLVLGRLDLAANHMDDARKEADAAARLEPASKAAQELSRQAALKAGRSQ